MVLFKRKAIPPIPPQTITDDNQEVWLLEASGEIFTSYEAYLARVDFFRQKKFICEVSGHSNMTYWEALKSEKQAARGVDQAFPESLKEPVLRKIQFSTVSRLDHLVENIYEQFKEDFYPGETLTVSIQGYRLPCLLREKTRFSALFLKDGTTRPAITRYRIELVSPPSKIKSYDLGPEQNVGEEQLQRDRVQFNKALIRAFIKNSCWREQWTGAPWLVKERYARRFRIDMNVPEHLRRRPKLEEKLPEQKEDRRRKKVPDEIIKYPIDDLDERLAFDAASRPRLKQAENLDNTYLGDLLSTWTFLNMFSEPLRLDSFTLDDYIDSLRYTQLDFPCELTAEIHCALLKTLVTETEAECLVPLPSSLRPSKAETKQRNGDKNGDKNGDVVINGEDENDSIADSQESSTPSVSESYSKIRSLRTLSAKHMSTTWSDWRLKTQQRDFLNGGWESIIIGILDDLSNSYRLTPIILPILTLLLNDKHSRKTARDNYARLPAQHKLKILSLLVQLVCQTPTIREHIEDCMLGMTELRKDKVDVQRDRKAKIEELASLEADLLPWTLPPEQESNSDTSSEPQKRSVKASLKRKREEAEEVLKRQKEMLKRQKLVDDKRKEIKACEERITGYDHELREKDCQRLKLVGKDRFFNRYWLLEGNGFPYVGRRSDAGFTSARVWVQGPSLEDALFYLGGAGVSDVDEFGVNGRVSAVDPVAVGENTDLRERVLSRKEREEGQSILWDENQWGYYDDVEGVEGLLAWLNPKGVREAKLRQVLLTRKDALYKVMDAREKYLNPDVSPVEVRRSTRITTVHGPEFRFLKWHNTANEEKKKGRRL